MPATTTLAALRSYARQLSDMEDDAKFVTDEELNRYVNDGAAGYYDILIDADDAKLLAKNGGVLTKTGDFAWDMPNDFYRLVSLNWKSGQGYWEILPADTQDAAILSARWKNKRDAKYLLRVKSMVTGQMECMIYPKLEAPDRLAMSYIPLLHTLVDDTDTIASFGSWDSYIATYAALMMRRKQDLDISVLVYDLKEMEDNIRNAFEDIDIARPKTIRELNDPAMAPWYL